MKKLLNTLFVTTQGAYLHRDGETVTARKDGELLLRVPSHTLQSIVCFGRVTLSAPLMGFCADSGILITYLSETGEFWARIQGRVAGNVLLRRNQYRAADAVERSAPIAQAMVMAKIANCRSVLMRALRDQKERLSEIENAATRLGRTLERLLRDQFQQDHLRGIEGESASVYFGAFEALIVAQKQNFQFTGRSRRPPLDPVNALLSFAYTLLVHDVAAALESVGLDPYVGFLHTDRPGRPGLALDLMEEFRPILADRLVLNLINRQQVAKEDFRHAENGAVLMTNGARRTLIQAWQKRKQEEVRHAFVGESAALGLFPYLQALLLARHLRGDLDAYPALVWK